jgi:hypothetical protein
MTLSIARWRRAGADDGGGDVGDRRDQDARRHLHVEEVRLRPALTNVRYWDAGKHLLAASISGFDPFRK